MIKRTLIVVVLAAAMFLLAGTVPVLACNATSAAKTCSKTTAATATTASATAARAEGETVILNVSKMTCGGCVTSVTKSLAAIEGVTDVTVNLASGTAEVIYDAGKTKPAVLAETVTKAGYPAELAKVVTASDKATAGSCSAKCSKSGCDPTACGMKAAEVTNDDK